MRLLQVDWLSLAANHPEFSTFSDKDKRIRFVSQEDVPTWVDLLLAQHEDFEE
ncbi:hypothetical protein [Scrofimicrobium canadense]|uniref:hypothetical protein n=1 Tax=Scrofimicrobium canadense TaxID=2652290 RepID=UPI0012B35CAC|nr:hypothetical protein [Scrofimicrobium canadense]